MERSRTFFLDVEPAVGGGESDLGVKDELRLTIGGGDAGELGGLPLLLSPVAASIGSVGLSGNGVLLHLFPCLKAAGTPRRWIGAGIASSCAASLSSGERVGSDLCWRR